MVAFALVVLCQIGSPQGVRLLDDAPLIAQAPTLAPPMVASEARVSAAQLQVDLEALRKMRPGVGGGIALVASGGTAALLGALYLGLGAGIGSALGAVVSPFVVLGAIGLGVGGPLILIGVWLLWNRIEERNRIDEEMKSLRLQLQQARPPPRPSTPYSPPPPSEVLPPPQVLGPENSLQLAAF